MRLKVLFLIILCQYLRFTNGDVDVRIDELEAQVTELRDEVTGLSDMIKNLETSVVNRNIADQKLDKAIANVLLNNQGKAAIYWREVTKYVDPSLLNGYLKTLIENAYLGNSENFYYTLDFLIRNDLYMGFPMLLKELEQHRELHSGQEIFVLAHQIKSLCGMSNELYNKMPKVVRDVLAGSVILKNIHNNGYVLADENSFPCENSSSCYQNPKSQVFVDLISSTTTIDNLKDTMRAQWQFMGPPNVTELAKGFYMKNMDKDLFFVFGQRPPQAFLKGNSTLKPYYSADMILQFLPALVPNAGTDENLIRIGVRDKFSKKISYFYAGEFSKKITRLNFSRLPIFKNDVKGFVWEVIPASGDHIDNTIDGGETDEKCKFTM